MHSRLIMAPEYDNRSFAAPAIATRVRAFSNIAYRIAWLAHCSREAACSIHFERSSVRLIPSQARSHLPLLVPQSEPPLLRQRLA